MFDTPNFWFQRNVRAQRLNPAYADNGKVTFWAVMGDVNNAGFTNDAAGANAKVLADKYVLYVFPTRTGNPIGLGNNRQADIVDLSGGYFSNDPLGLWIHIWISYTDAAFNTKDGQKALADLQKKNGTALDGTPIIKTKSELENLLSKGFAQKRFRNPDGSEGPMYGICPVMKDPTNGGIAAIAASVIALAAAGSAMSAVSPSVPTNCRTAPLTSDTPVMQATSWRIVRSMVLSAPAPWCSSVWVSTCSIVPPLIRCGSP